MSLESTIDEFQGITLAQMDGVKLMNRTDRKYWFSSEQLTELLAAISSDYYIMEIGGERNLPYSTTYYDTLNNEMFANHHRGKLNRYKIRRRNYVSTQTSFLEVKFKSNKGRTVKVRRVSDYNTLGFDVEDQLFIGKNTPYECDQLHRVLRSDFRRLMLVGRSMNERCTIDSELHFVSSAGELSLDRMVIVEVKSEGRSHSKIVEALDRMRIKSSGFSKYCVGRSLTDSELKQNRFKRQHREIERKLR
ncbi:MAG: polyphosphate polymerase domain-containing protein [Rikenellaceae bacterium]